MFFSSSPSCFIWAQAKKAVSNLSSTITVSLPVFFNGDFTTGESQTRDFLKVSEQLVIHHPRGELCNTEDAVMGTWGRWTLLSLPSRAMGLTSAVGNPA